jgi:hypothetical protein
MRTTYRKTLFRLAAIALVSLTAACASVDTESARKAAYATNATASETLASLTQISPDMAAGINNVMGTIEAKLASAASSTNSIKETIAKYDEASANAARELKARIDKGITVESHSRSFVGEKGAPVPAKTKPKSGVKKDPAKPKPKT